MLTFGGSVRIFVCVEPTDMRRGFDRLAATAHQVTEQDPLSGYLFIFINRRRDRVKILYWDGSGLWVVAKRLEKGTFSWPEDSDGGRSKISLSPTALAMLTDGVQLRDGCKRPWYEARE